MKDIQSQVDHRRINIKKVGVKTVSYPVTVLDKAKSHQQTIATVNMYVNLPHCFKGTHMSRFVEILNQYHGAIDLRNFHQILEEMKHRLEAQASHMEIEFPFFLTNGKSKESLNTRKYQCMMCGSFDQEQELEFRITVPIALPMSKEYVQNSLPRSTGNWGNAEIAVRFNTFMWIEDLINEIESCIAREIEAVAEASQNILSVEAVTRGIGTCLNTLKGIKSYAVRVENLSDDYSTFAMLES
ncbi:MULTISPECIES: GTP cyclohydrolase I FolE2 [Desulfosediminicola]|uniref:GTP cyclohydrolase I FolE2 n=1 Tax=Desulfosediminicola TaxID=2886823 RepID=UPI0010AC058E|nr:GTP cyclohydrolase, FolE2/MptA family [Desulfosediminicola ganghwensis]